MCLTYRKLDLEGAGKEKGREVGLVAAMLCGDAMRWVETLHHRQHASQQSPV